MSHSVAEWNQKQSKWPEIELVELLDENENASLESQHDGKLEDKVGEFGQANGEESKPNLSDQIHEEPSSWFRYPIHDSLYREVYSNFLSEMPIVDTGTNEVHDLEAKGVGEFVTIDQSHDLMSSTSKNPFLSYQENAIKQPRLQVETSTVNSNSAFSLGNASVVKFPHFIRQATSDFATSRSIAQTQLPNGSSSKGTIGMSFFGSNQVRSETVGDNLSDIISKSSNEDLWMPQQQAWYGTYDVTMDSTSGHLESTNGRKENQGQQRKERNILQSCNHSKHTKKDWLDANKTARKSSSSSSRRSRAAEVHNLSERRRRDRINEKMRALQEMIPNSSKTDKASMLDEAIEYLKSLQLQVQIMWMGSQMAHTMFPGLQHYMQSMGIGIGHFTTPLGHNPVHPPRSPLIGKSCFQESSSLHMDPSSTPNQIPTVNVPGHVPYDYLGYEHIQPLYQATNMYAYGSHMAPQNQSATASISTGPSTSEGGPSDNMKGQSSML